LFDDSINVAVDGDLSPGEQVVTEGQLRLVPGAKVLVEGAKPARPAAGARGAKRPGANRKGKAA
jgi:hypothetical protein